MELNDRRDSGKMEGESERTKKRKFQENRASTLCLEKKRSITFFPTFDFRLIDSRNRSVLIIVTSVLYEKKKSGMTGTIGTRTSLAIIGAGIFKRIQL